MSSFQAHRWGLAHSINIVGMVKIAVVGGSMYEQLRSVSYATANDAEGMA